MREATFNEHTLLKVVWRGEGRRERLHAQDRMCSKDWKGTAHRKRQREKLIVEDGKQVARNHAGKHPN